MSVLIISTIIWMIELLLILQLFHIRINEYDLVTLYVTNNQEGVVVVNQQERKTIYSNSYCYLKNKKITYKILEENKLEKDLVQIRLKLKWKDINKDDIIEISIKNKKRNIIDCIINSWDGDNNNKS